MNNTTNEHWLVRHRWILLALLCGYGIGQWRGLPSFAHADVRESAPRAAFQAGSERSEATLKEIATTLKTIDRRMEVLEKAAEGFRKP